MRTYRRGVTRFTTRRRGLTLVELMVTVCLLAIGLVGVSSMFIVGYRTQVHAHYASVASDQAGKTLERMRAAGFNHISSTLFPSPFTLAELPSGQGAIQYAPYPDATSTNQYFVTVTVEWGGGPGVEGQVMLSSVISNHS